MIMDNNNSNNNNSNKPNNKVNMPKFNLNWMYMIIALMLLGLCGAVIQKEQEAKL